MTEIYVLSPQGSLESRLMPTDVKVKKFEQAGIA
jgi:hypothetical protein